jgi:hypothetical protein
LLHFRAYLGAANIAAIISGISTGCINAGCINAGGIKTGGINIEGVNRRS